MLNHILIYVSVILITKLTSLNAGSLPTISKLKKKCLNHSLDQTLEWATWALPLYYLPKKNHVNGTKAHLLDKTSSKVDPHTQGRPMYYLLDKLWSEWNESPYSRKTSSRDQD